MTISILLLQRVSLLRNYTDLWQFKLTLLGPRNFLMLSLNSCTLAVTGRLVALLKLTKILHFSCIWKEAWLWYSHKAELGQGPSVPPSWCCDAQPHLGVLRSRFGVSQGLGWHRGAGRLPSTTRGLSSAAPWGSSVTGVSVTPWHHHRAVLWWWLNFLSLSCFWAWIITVHWLWLLFPNP